MEPRIQYAQTADGVNIAFWTMGEGMPLIHMPPIPWSHLQAEWRDPEYRRWFEQLGRGKQFIRYDSRGSGLSDRDLDDYSPEKFLLDVDAVVDRLGLGLFVLVGVSPSTPIAIMYAALNPQRVSRLVLWSATTSEFGANSTQWEVFLELLRRDWQLYTQTTAHALVAGWGAGEQAARFAELMREAIDQAGAQKTMDAWRDLDVSEYIPRVECPVLILQRRELLMPDPEEAKSIAARARNAQLVLLEGGAHLPWVGDMEAVVRASDEFLGLPVGKEERLEPAAFPPIAGLVTVLFTDIEGSTTLTQRLGDAGAQEVLRAHNGIVREALRGQGGAEIKHTGDGIMASFPLASRALECAIAIQRAVEEWNRDVVAAGRSPLQIRIGLNAGEPVAEEQDLYGTAVQLAARICAAAEPGQVVVSDVVRQLAAGKGFLFSDMGETVLRGFEDPLRLFEVRWRDQT